MVKVDSADTVAWSSPRDMNEVTISAGRPCAVQKDDDGANFMVDTTANSSTNYMNF